MTTNLSLAALLSAFVLTAPPARADENKVPDVWHPLPVRVTDGLLSNRLDLWRSGRLWHMLEAEDDYLLSGFENHPGRHPWQGEHVGKWLHAATLAYEQSRDPKLLDGLQKTVSRLLAAQEPNGYLGTYGRDHRFTAMPENVRLSDIADDIEPRKKPKNPKRGNRKPSGGWDTWTLRYNIYGLLTYERYHPDPRIVEACRKMADLLITVYGEGKHDLTNYGTRKGISATTLLESIVMLYERTRDEKYLEFAEHIVAMSENNPGLRLMGVALEKGTLTKPGEGKAYQMMANLLGYLRLHACTGRPQYLEAVENAWQSIRSLHTYSTGGPWSRKLEYNGNKECFALLRDFSPELAQVETCSTTTWIQLNLHLFELTGQAKYAAEAERTVFNALLAAQNHEGIDWCYFTKANSPKRPFESRISCCASSGPRALEMFAHNLVGIADEAVSLASLAPCRVALPEDFGNAAIEIAGNYPVSPSAVIRFKKANATPFPIEFRDPAGGRLASVKVNGKPAKAEKNDRGFYRIDRPWKTGDEIAVEFEYQLLSHIVRPSDDQHLVAFTYGPWALAGKRGAASPAREPLIGKPVTAGPATEWLEALPVRDGELPTFRIKGTKLVLQPYHSTGSLTAGPQTYFKLLPSKNASSDARRPNIILFLVDDLGWSDLGCYGSTFHDTPNIDALAGEGVRFTDAYATCHVCSPSRASILTGKYPARLKLTDWLPGRKDHSFQRLKNAPIHQALPLDETTLAEALKPHGYRTGHFGKWHLGEAPAGPLAQGFDIQVPQNWFKGWPKAGYHAPFKFDGFAEKNGDYLTDRLTDEALKFIDRNRNDPFFLYLPHFAVHDPIQGRGDLVKKYEQRCAKLPPEEKPFILEGNPDSKDPLSRERLDRLISEKEYTDHRVLPQRTVKIKQRQDNPQFAAMVESVDESLGRVVAKLKALDLEDDTIIIFTSDNGGMSAANFGRPDRVVAPEKLDTAYSTSNLPLRGAKGWLYEGGIRVPLIIKWPGKGKAGSTCREPVIGTDYYPTVLDMLGLPASPGQHPDGRSLAPLFDGKTTLERDAIYWHFPHYSNHGMQSPGGAIRTGRYKLLEYFENGTVHLFDLETDPGELRDLAKSRPEIAARLLAKLRKWRKDVGAEMMTTTAGTSRPAQRPNILFCISDDQSYEHTGANGDPVVQTPAFDRIARSGIRFVNAFCDAPTCGPSRSAILTGQSIWRLEQAGNIHSTLPAKFDTYTALLEQAGYATGFTGKGWGPGRLEPGGRSVNPAGPEHNAMKLKSRTLAVSDKDYAGNFEAFLTKLPKQQPFCFWLGTHEPHRGYKKGSGAAAGRDPGKVIVPPSLPDNDEVRNDILDYYLEIEHYDTMVARALASLEQRGLLENTIVVMTSDHGMPFPRAKASLYDAGTRVPLAISWPSGIQAPGRTVGSFVNLSDLAPTFLEAAGLKPPMLMTARSMLDILANRETGDRTAAFIAMERHDGCRAGGKGYPCRAIRTRDYLYIHNFEPTRWPSGSPDASDCARAIPYGEIDSSPTKDFMIENRDRPDVKKLAELAFGTRPADELYAIKKDPGQLENLADRPKYESVLKKMKSQLMGKLEATGDPRVIGGPVIWDHLPYYGARKNKNWAVESISRKAPGASPEPEQKSRRRLSE